MNNDKDNKDNYISIIEDISVIAAVENLEILSSGVIHLEEGKELLLKFLEDEFKIKFESDGGEIKYVGESITPTLMKVTLFNHNSPHGQGQMIPFQIASYEDGRFIKMSYFSWAVRDSRISNLIHRFEYVLYVGQSNGSNR